MANTKQGIYYQDNYSSVADVPSDMKKMAESVDAELEKDRGRLSTNEANIEQNTSDIANIKTKNDKQDTSIQNNTKEITRLNDLIGDINTILDDINGSEV